MKNQLREILKGRIVIVGVGNIMRGDDALGPELIRRIDGCVDAVCIDAGTALENYSGKIIKVEPDTILIVDAVSLGKTAGAWELLSKEDIIKSGLTTHDISPKMFIEYLETRTKARIYMLGVQPKELEFSADISKEVLDALETIEKVLKEVIHA